ncbi:MAG: SRPBCC domain-containing protein [Acidimicrobiales bacterium]
MRREDTAPLLIPVAPSDKVKTRATPIASPRGVRSGQLTAVRVPSAAEEAAGDLCRARTDMVIDRSRLVEGVLVRVSTSKVRIQARPETVWATLRGSEHVNRWQYGSVLRTTWAVDSTIRFTSEWEGQTFEQWGTVLAFDPPPSFATHCSHLGPISKTGLRTTSR